jgi:hypothetical protein
MHLITLSKNQFLVLAVMLVALATLCAVVVLYPAGFYNFKCTQFELPHYQAAFGFTLGEMETPGSSAEPRRVLAIVALDPNGVLARSGARVGDVPPMYHGISDFCGDLGAAGEGQTVPMHVYNLSDAKAGREPWREIQLQTR